MAGTNNRVCIFMVYGQYGVEEYAYYLADALKKIAKDLIIVCNMPVSQKERERFQKITGLLHERANTGFDSGAFKDALDKYLTWEAIGEYEELLLVNDSCYGPIYPLEAMFGEMDANRGCLDFWGVTENEAHRESPYHIQSYFMVVRKRLLHSMAFREFWDTWVIPTSYWEAVRNYEWRFTTFFQERGFVGGAYIDNSELCTIKGEEQANIFCNTHRLVSKCRCPLVKRKAFKFSRDQVLDFNAGATARKTLEHISENTGYDTDMIIDDMIHNMEPHDIRLALHLDYVSPGGALCAAGRKICVVVYIEGMVYAEKCVEKVCGLPGYVRVFIVAGDDGIARFLGNAGLGGNVSLVDSEDGEWREQILQSDNCCVLYDNLGSLRINNTSAMQSYADLVWENMVCDENHIKYISRLFETEKRLGLLVPPEPYFSTFLTMGEFLRKQNGNSFFTVNSAFWARADVMVKVLDGVYFNRKSDMLLGKLVPGLARDLGYYCGVIMTREYASLYTVNYQFTVGALLRKTMGNSGMIAGYSEMLMGIYELEVFCRKHKKIYIYGAGNYGHRCLAYIRQNGIEFLGFVVSDGHRAGQQGDIAGKIYELSELEMNDDEGIVIAIKNKPEKLGRELEKRGIRNVMGYPL